MEWLQSNWIWLVFGAAMIGMHLFGHGRHGHGHRHGNPGKENRDGSVSTRGPTAAPPTDAAHAGGAVLTVPVSKDQPPHNATAHLGHGTAPIPTEEREAVAAFGDAYRRYAARVPAFIPRSLQPVDMQNS